MRIIGSLPRRPGTQAVFGSPSLRVLHLDHTVAPGGAELALLRMLLSAPGWSASLLLPRSDSGEELGVFGPLAEAGHVSLVFAGPDQPPGASRGGVRATVQAAVSISRSALAVRASRDFRNAQVVHANTSRAAVIAAMACLLTRKCLVIHLRDRVERDSLGRFGVTTLALALSRASGVVANSRSTLASAERYLPSATSRTVLPSAAGLASRSRTDVPTARTEVATVVMVARIDPWKGQDVLLQAFAEVFRHTDTRLVLAGGAAFDHEDHLGTLRSTAESLGIAAQVDFLGHVVDVPHLLESADVCVQASVRPEPLGQNVLQYLAAGKPTIATREGGPAEWVEDGVNGLLVPMGDATALAKALRTLAGEPGLRQRLAAAAAATAGLSTDAEVTAEHHRFFTHCAQERRTGSREAESVA